MKSRVLFGILIVAVTAFSVQAQPQGGRGGRGFGFGRGFDGGVVADILVLKEEKAKTVEEKMDAAREEIMAEFRDNSGDRPDFQAMRENSTQKYAAALKPVLSEEELKMVEPFLGGFRMRTYAPVRAVRQIELKDDQRSKLRTETVAMYSALEDARPEFGGRGGGGDRSGFEEWQTKSEEIRKDYSVKVLAILTEEQKSAWETKTKEVEAEMEEQRAQRRERGGFGGGRGGNN